MVLAKEQTRQCFADKSVRGIMKRLIMDGKGVLHGSRVRDPDSGWILLNSNFPNKGFKFNMLDISVIKNTVTHISP